MAFFSSEMPINEWINTMEDIASAAPIEWSVMPNLFAGIIFFLIFLIFGNFAGRHTIMFAMG